MRSAVLVLLLPLLLLPLLVILLIFLLLAVLNNTPLHFPSLCVTAGLKRTQMRPILTHVSTNIGQNYDTVGAMLPETIEVLNEFYKPFVLRLYELLGDEKFLWKDIAVT